MYFIFVKIVIKNHNVPKNTQKTNNNDNNNACKRGIWRYCACGVLSCQPYLPLLVRLLGGPITMAENDTSKDQVSSLKL